MSFSRLRVLVITGGFPKTSETFVLDSVKRLLDCGVELQIVAQRHKFSSYEKNMFSADIASCTTHFGRPFRTLLGSQHFLSLVCKPCVWLFTVKAILSNDARLHLSLLAQAMVIYLSIKGKPKFDVIHAYFGPMGIVGSYLKQLGVADRLVTSFLGYDISRMAYGVKPIDYKFLFANADALLPISALMGKELVRLGASFNKVRVHHIGVDVARFSYHSLPTRMPKQLRLISVARFTEKKGLEFGLKAIHNTLMKQPDFDLSYWIVGDGELGASLKALTLELGISQQVVFKGVKSHSDCLQLMRQVHAFLAPSVTAKNGDREGIPIVLMEAMAMGLPVISSRHAGIPELVSHGLDGFLANERDVEQLTAAILKLSAMSEAEIRKITLRAREKVLNDFNAKTAFDFYLNQILRAP